VLNISGAHLENARRWMNIASEFQKGFIEIVVYHLALKKLKALEVVIMVKWKHGLFLVEEVFIG